MKLVQYAVVLGLLGGPVLADARPRIVVPSVKADPTGAISRQLRKALCAAFECAPRGRAYTGTRPDYAKARRNGVAAIVFGALTGEAPNRMLWLGLYTGSRDPDRTWLLPLSEKGIVRTRALAGAVSDLERRLAPPVVEPRPPPTAAAPAAPVPRATAEAAPPTASAPSAPRLAPAEPPRAPTPNEPPRRLAAVPPPPPPSPPSTTAPRGPSQPPWAAIELGAYVAQRRLEYSGASPPGSSSLLAMTADAIVCPSVALEVFPAAAAAGPFAGLGAFAGYRRSVGFDVTNAAESRAAVLASLGAGIVWRLPPVSSLRLVFSPAVSYERLDLTVSNGGISGLPDAHLRGVKVGSGLAVPVTGRYALLLAAGYVVWTSSENLVGGSVPFFPSGRARAITAEGGLSVALFGRYSAKVVGEYTSTSYSLDADPTGTYRASGATDRYVGARAAVRGEF